LYDCPVHHGESAARSPRAGDESDRPRHHQTLVEGLERVRRADAYRKAMALKGRVRLTIDLAASRERRRR
jgi:hypothetical protein